MLFDLLHDCHLKDSNSFFKRKQHNTWTSHLHKTHFAINRFVMRPTGKKAIITDTKAVSHGEQSDHLPIIITIKIKPKCISNKGRKTKGKNTRKSVKGKNMYYNTR
jgi:hypothetical protein